MPTSTPAPAPRWSRPTRCPPPFTRATAAYPIVQLTITTDVPQNVRVSAEMPDLTYVGAETVLAMPSGARVSLHPLLRPDAFVQLLADQDLPLVLTISDMRGHTLWTRQDDLHVLSRTTMVWTDALGRDLSPYIVAWVTPKDPRVLALVTQATAFRHMDGTRWSATRTAPPPTPT